MTDLHFGVIDYEGFKTLSVGIARGTSKPNTATLWFPSADALERAIAPEIRGLLARLHPDVGWEILTIARTPPS